MYTLDGDKVVNDNGEVAVRYLTTIPHVVSISDTDYSFVVQYNVNISWVKPEHLSAIMAIKKQCCGGSSRPKYVFANELAVRLWLGMGR